MNPLVLIGGLAMRGAEFAPLAERLRAAGREAFYFDNLQVGDGPRVEIPSIEAQAEHAWHRIDVALGAGSQVALFGLSMGGMIAATMAARVPQRVDRLLLGATSPNAPETEAISHALYGPWVGVRSEGELYESIRIAFGATTERERPEIVRAYYEHRLHKRNGQSRRDFVAQLDAIRVFPGAEVYAAVAAAELPAVVISGEEDRLFPAAHSAWIARRLRCPQRGLPRTGHMLHLENEAELAASILAAAT